MKKRLHAAKEGWLFLGVWVAAAAIIAGLGWSYLGHQRALFRERVENELTAIADLKARQIVDWREERLANARAIVLDPFLAQAVREFLENPQNRLSQPALLTKLQSIQALSQSLRTILLDSNLQVQLAFPGGNSFFGPIAQTFAAQALRSNMVVISDLHRARGAGAVHFDVAIPLRPPSQLTNAGSANPPPGPIGVIDVEVDPYQFLYPLVQRWPTPTLSGETELVERDGTDILLLNDLPGRANSALSVRMPLSATNLVGVQAVLGREGLLAGLDYRGEPVLAAVRALPGCSWCVVAKMDEQEIFAPLRARNKQVLVAMLGLVLGVGLALRTLWHARERGFLERELVERSRTEAQLRKLSRAVEQSPASIVITDRCGCIEYVNPKFCAVTGYTREEACGQNPRVLKSGEMPPEGYRTLWKTLLQGQEWHGEFHNKKKNGQLYWEVASISPILDDAGQITHFVAVKEDITERKEAEAKPETVHRELLQTSRLAGMAEVATGVLHNVGNVLNSVNVASNCLASRLRSSRVAALNKLAEILRQQQANWAAFATSDPRGQKLPAFVGQLAECLVAERADALEEIGQLQKNIDHIKDIIVTQQEYAKTSGVVETLQAGDLIQEALRLNASSLSRHDVQVSQELAHTPPLTVEKHKVLGILVNLIQNAKHACDAARKTDKRLTLRSSNGGATVKIFVSDNGVGIPPENLTRIFNHGFTTRKSGHGFGLHISALAAREWAAV